MPPNKQSVSQRFEGIQVLIDKVGRLTHAGTAMVVAAALDRLLEHALLTKMNKLNRKIYNKLFGDYGSLRDFSIKIDLSFALGLADRETYKRLTTIRKIRNIFAHAEGFVNFDSPAIRTLLPSFADNSSKLAPFDEFMSIATAIESAVTKATSLPYRGIIDKVKADG